MKSDVDYEKVVKDVYTLIIQTRSYMSRPEIVEMVLDCIEKNTGLTPDDVPEMD